MDDHVGHVLASASHQLQLVVAFDQLCVGLLDLEVDLHARDKFLGRERLGQIVLTTPLEALQTRLQVALRGQEKHGDLGPWIGMPLAHQIQAAAVGQSNVEHDQIGAVGVEEAPRLDGRAAGVDAEGLGFQDGLAVALDVDIVFDDQHAVGHGITRRVPCRDAGAWRAGRAVSPGRSSSCGPRARAGPGCRSTPVRARCPALGPTSP